MSLRTTIKNRLAAFGLGLVVANAADAAATLKALGTPDIETARSGMAQAAWRDGLSDWLENNLKSDAVPFYFVYDGKSSREFLANCEFTEMELTHLKLYPGEEIRTPKMMLLFWQGHRYYGQNLLRRMVLAHYHPQKDGKPATMPFAASMDAWTATEQNQLDYAARFEKLGIEYLWLDAGWWKDSDSREKVFPTHIGPISRERFPHGFRRLTDALKKKGMGLVVWFAPEYQGGGSWMNRAFPEFFLRLKKGGQADMFTIMNFGDRNALQFLTDATASRIETEGIGVYRLDGPMGGDCPLPEKQPLPWWREADTPDRQGITEIRYVEGLYSSWDEIVRRNPGLLIDLCGGGATRIDIEAMSRCVYAWRSDWNHPGFEPEAEQSRTYAASFWLPSTGTASGYPESYSFRSSINNGVALCWHPDQPPVSPLAAPVKQKPP